MDDETRGERGRPREDDEGREMQSGYVRDAELATRGLEQNWDERDDYRVRDGRGMGEVTGRDDTRRGHDRGLSYGYQPEPRYGASAPGDWGQRGYGADVGDDPRRDLRTGSPLGGLSQASQRSARVRDVARGLPRGQSARDFRGRGPRGYQRSDSRIREDVCDLLTEDPRLDPSELEVTVKDSEVYLDGIVDVRASKRLAEDLAESCRGVRDVHNRLRLRTDRSADGAGSEERGPIGH